MAQKDTKKELALSKQLLQSITAQVVEHRKIKKLSKENRDSIMQRIQDEAKARTQQTKFQKEMLSNMGAQETLGRELVLSAKKETESRRAQIGYLASANEFMMEAVKAEEELVNGADERTEIEKKQAEIQARIKQLKSDNLGLSAAEVAEELKTLKLVDSQLQKTNTKMKIIEEEKKKQQQIKDIQDEGLKLFGLSLDQVDEFGKSLDAVVANPMVALIAGVGMLLNHFKGLVSDAMELRKELGVTAFTAMALQHSISGVAREFSMLGVSSEDVATAAGTIADEFGGISKVTRETLRGVVGLSAEFGISGDNAAKLLKQMEGINGASLESNINLLESAASLAKANGVAPADVLNDVAESTEMFAKFAKDGGKNVLEAAINAKKLGINMATVEKMVDSIMDIENSIAAEMEASVLLGRQINLNKAREAFLAGDIAGGQQEIVKQLGSSAEFNEMNYYQRQALAKSLGVEVAELSKMIANQEELNNRTGLQAANATIIETVMRHIGRAFQTVVELAEMLIIPLGVATVMLIGMKGILAVGILGAMTILLSLFQELGPVGKTVTAVLLTMAGAALMFRNNLFGAGGGLLKNMTGGIKKLGATVAGLVPTMGAFNTVTGGKGASSVVSGSGKMNMASLLKGAFAMLIIAGAIGVLGLALQTFTNIDFGQVFLGLAALAAFTVGALLLGAVISSGAGAVLFGAGIIAMIAMGAALIILGLGFMAVGKGIQLISGGLGAIVGQIGSLVSVSGGILTLAGVFTTLGFSIMTLASSLLMLTPMLPTLMMLSALGAMAGGSIGGMQSQGESGDDESSLGARIDATNQKLDQLIALYQEGGIVQMDGKRVGEVLGRQILKPSIA